MAADNRAWSYQEEQPAFDNEEADAPDQMPQPLWRRWLAVSLMIAALVGGFVVTTTRSSDNSLQAATDALVEGTISSNRLVVTSSNAYTERDGKPYLKYYPWLAKSEVLEPYRPSTLSVTNAIETAEYSWTISLDQQRLTGSTVSFTCYQPGQIPVFVSEIIDGEVTRNFFATWYCKYVRRELRNLFNEDRNAVFDAMRVLYEVEDGLGQRIFGSTYRSMNAFINQHNTMAGMKDCDHAHDGRGFLIAHTVLTNTFEHSIQAVNPSVSVPYWDFTIDHSNLAQGVIDSWFDSEVFQDDWLGEADPKDHVITRGRWAYLPVQTNVQSITDVHNAYGILRAPWNVNPTPFITRCGTMMGAVQPLTHSPSCSSHYTLMSKHSWMAFALLAQYAPHGGVHTMIGGMWGSIDYKTAMAEFGYSKTNSNAIAQSAYILQKYMWRAGHLVCPSSCPANLDVDLCKCTCPEIDTMTDDDMVKIFASYSTLANEKYYVNEDGEDVKAKVIRILCQNDPGVYSMMGDQLESASPADPSFWPVHPTLERVWQWKRINGFKDETWSAEEGDCYGHGPDDIQPFQHVTPDQESPLTNSELYDFLNPNNDGLPYIYDNFEWPHCEAEGYGLNLLG